MAERLTPAQLRAAQRLLDRGLTLRETAGRIDVSFDAVCIGLYGDNQPSKGNDDGSVHAPAGQPDLRGSGGPDGVAGADYTAGEAGAVSSGQAEPLADGLREEGGAAAAPEPVGAVEPASEPAEPAVASPFPAVAEGSRATRAADVGDGGEATAPGQRFRLVSEHGESLHENERVLTRMPRFFWRGDAGDVALLKARRPQWARLRAVEVLS